MRVRFKPGTTGPRNLRRLIITREPEHESTISALTQRIIDMTAEKDRTIAKLEADIAEIQAQLDAANAL